MQLLVFSFLLSCNLLFTQNGTAYYKKQLSNRSESKGSNYAKLALREIEKQEYELTFNTEKAHFKMVKAMSTNDNPIIKAFIDGLSGFKGNVYFDRENKQVIHEKEFAGNMFLIKKMNLKWILTNKKLKIDQFVCFNATTSIVVSNSEGDHVIEINAWYAPELPVPYGPDGFGGLPGLILQLENNGTITTITQLLFSEKEVTINLPNLTNVIDEADFNKIASKQFENRKN